MTANHHRSEDQIAGVVEGFAASDFGGPVSSTTATTGQIANH